MIELLAGIESLETEITELRSKVVRLKVAEADLVERGSRLSYLLRSMDVDAMGNAGWERRFGWFLAEMRRQLIGSKK